MARPKPPTATWISRERRRLAIKTDELARRINAAGGQVSEQTIRVWESNADRRPSAYNLEILENIFGSKAPEARPSGEAETAALVGALAELVAELRADREARTASTARVVGESPVRYSATSSPAALRDRRRYWLERATARLKMTNEEVERRMGLDKGQFGRWERGESWPRGKRLERLAETVRIPLAILEDPPATDEERLDAWFAETIAPAERERRSA